MEKEYLVIGLMSGTSLDGLDIAACRFFKKEDQWRFEIVNAQSVEYDQRLKQQLAGSVDMTGLELSLLDLSLGRFFGEKVATFCKEKRLRPLFISSHGHTVFHQPEKSLTLQIGNPESLSYYAGLPVIANFRLLDVLHGGQGAPLVPVGEKFLFPDCRLFLNLGGIANIAVHEEEKISGYDVTVCNMALNFLAAKNEMAYDENGNLARSGKVDGVLLEKLNSLPFYAIIGPKSLGFEWFSEVFKPLIENAGSVADTLCTVVHHIAIQINREVNKVPALDKSMSVMVTGGGAFNEFLITQLNTYGEGRQRFQVPEKAIVEYKEALVFAFLGLRRALGLPNVSHLVTGATTDVSAGSIHGPGSFNFL